MRKQHWSFVAPVRPAVPQLATRKSQIVNPIDAFILARLELNKINPSSEADRVTLIRRLSLDLIGLPPTPAEVDEFLGDGRPDAYERLVDRFLASPHHGERWGRHWLDVARYADSNGYSIDAPRSIWKYRDWVIAALNRDLPFDQFVIEQLAGDLLPNATLEQKIATGFHRNTQINEEGGIDKEQFRIESIIDRVNTTGTAFLGLTIGCCQCHDHKFDPLTQKEFYGLFAFLNNAEEPDLPLASPEDIAREKDIQAQVAAYIASLSAKDAAIWERMLAWERSLTPAQRQAQSQQVREAFDVQFPNRTDAQNHTVLAAFVEGAAENKTHQEAIKKLRATMPKIPTTMVLRERDSPRRTYLFTKGDFTRDGGTVGPGVPAILHPLRKSETTNRLDLAKWLVDPKNPLLARVTVNRLWQQYFGKGIVETENDFGTQGSPPSHPELLDWLACELMDPNAASDSASPGEEGRGEGGREISRSAASPWSLKHLHRLIVTSATYRQSSKARADLALVDPYNKLLARQTRLRLDAEIVRDVCLRAASLLDERIGGPPVFPPQPAGVMSLGQSSREWKPSTGAERHRRGLYTHFWRATPYPALAVFDAPDAFSACTRRLRSNTPLQALTLLNDEAFYEFAQALAARVLKEGPASDSARLNLAFRLCLLRLPANDERERLQALLENELQSQPTATAWTTVARVLLNLDEAITRE